MKLCRLPVQGRVVVAHPSCEASAQLHARIEGLDYVLLDLCPPGMIYLMNPSDQIMAPLAGGRP
jgi:hypothetical protein